MNISGSTITNSIITIDLTYLADPIVPVWYDLSKFNAGGMTIVDSSGNHNNGLISSSLDHEGLTIDTTNGGGIVLSGTQWIDTRTFLTQDFTVSMAIKIPLGINNFPASLWGTDIWDLNQGYLAALGDDYNLLFGLAGDGNNFGNANTVIVSAANFATPKIIDFVKEGTLLSVYINGQQAGQVDFLVDNGFGGTNATFGSRHQNDSTPGIADPLAASIYDIKIRNYPLTVAESNLIFQSLKSRYGL